ncbi:cuticle protein 19.8-like [Penaeus vannamei]|uniref:cuticle protein 19.8-like n=1 Tax=Penaeus vannamei TaxID=6689 RepID=UPI00387F45B9
MKVFVLLCLVAFAAAGSFESYEYRPSRFQRSSEESYESSEAKYSFNWAVSDDSSSNEFGHQEARDGDDTQGSYYVQLPDGRLQTVKYFVDGDSGYVAEVSQSYVKRWRRREDFCKSIGLSPVSPFPGCNMVGVEQLLGDSSKNS